jgi:hypothetical protein
MHVNSGFNRRLIVIAQRCANASQKLLHNFLKKLQHSHINLRGHYGKGE